LRLFSAQSSDEFDIGIFNAGDYISAVQHKINTEAISKILYPSDAIQSGRELRLLQEYFLVACSIRDIVKRYRQTHDSFDDFPAKVAIQMNDTHPALTIAEATPSRTASATRAREVYRRHFAEARQALDAFQPDVVVMFGDDQYENFKEDIIPPFCVLAYEEMTPKPWQYYRGPNVWNEPAEKSFEYKGHRDAGKIIAGGMSGKAFIVYHQQTNVGSSPKFEITLIHDPAIQPVDFAIS